MYMPIRVRTTHIGYHFKTEDYYVTMFVGFPCRTTCTSSCRTTAQTRESSTHVQYFAPSITQCRPNWRSGTNTWSSSSSAQCKPSPDFKRSQNHWGWRRSLRPPGPTIHLPPILTTKTCPSVPHVQFFSASMPVWSHHLPEQHFQHFIR